MVRNGKVVPLTEEDRKNLAFQDYTEQEYKNLVHEIRSNYRKESRILCAVLAGLIFMAWEADMPWSYAASIGIVLDISGLILALVLYRLNGNPSQTYVEVTVEKKLEVESYYENSVTTGPDVFHYYPIQARNGDYSFLCHIRKGAKMQQLVMLSEYQ